MLLYFLLISYFIMPEEILMYCHLKKKQDVFNYNSTLLTV